LVWFGVGGRVVPSRRSQVFLNWRFGRLVNHRAGFRLASLGSKLLLASPVQRPSLCFDVA